MEVLSETKENVLRREKTAVLKDLPDKVYQIKLVELEGPQLERYQELENNARRDASSKLGMKSNDLRNACSRLAHQVETTVYF